MLLLCGKCHGVILADHCPGVGIIATRKEKVSEELRNRRVLSLSATGEADGIWFYYKAFQSVSPKVRNECIV